VSKHKHPFYRISSLVTAADLQRPLGPHVESDANACDSYDRIFQGDSWVFDAVSLVMKGPDVVGWCSILEADVQEGNPATVAEYMDPIRLSMLVSGHTTFYDLANAFATREPFFYFVLDGSEITGTVSYLDLFSRTGQLCLLSLTFLLESVAEEFCLCEAQQCWSVLPLRRRELAQRVAARRFPRQSGLAQPSHHLEFASLLRSTTFMDKCIMITGANLLPSVPLAVIESIFENAERVRNLCSHGADDQELCSALPKNRFAEFLHDTQNLVETIRRSTQELDNA
jgi:hypothetical protein